MKTKTLLLSSILFLISCFQVLASGDEKKAEKKMAKSYFSIENQFVSKLHAPFFSTQSINPQKVTLTFHVTNSFKVVIESIECDDLRLKSHIIKSLANETILVDRENVNKSYSIMMTFK